MVGDEEILEDVTFCRLGEVAVVPPAGFFQRLAILLTAFGLLVGLLTVGPSVCLVLDGVVDTGCSVFDEVLVASGATFFRTGELLSTKYFDESANNNNHDGNQ